MARKRHKCCECRGWIEPGETYRYASGIWDYPESFKFCADCDALRAEVDEGVHGEDATPLGMLSESVGEGDDNLRARFIAIMRKRSAKIHWSWIKDQHAFPPSLPIL